MQPAIEIQGLTKRFPKTMGYRDMLTFWRRRYVPVLKGVNLTVPRGSVFGLLGLNGAGKTTLLKIISGLILPDEGTVSVHGVIGHERQRRDGCRLTYVPGDERSVYWRLTGRENLKFFAVLNEIPSREAEQRVEEALDATGLKQAADQRVTSYSTGMKQRLGIARGLLTDPEILLLDEPTRSLDPVGARKLWEIIKGRLVTELGKTVLIATHNLDEASRICDHVAILHQGRVQFSESVASLAEQANAKQRYVISLDDSNDNVLARLESLSGVSSVVARPNGHRPTTVEVTMDDTSDHVRRVLECLMDTGAKIVEVNPVQRALADAMGSLVDEAA